LDQVKRTQDNITKMLERCRQANVPGGPISNETLQREKIEAHNRIIAIEGVEGCPVCLVTKWHGNQRELKYNRSWWLLSWQGGYAIRCVSCYPPSVQALENGTAILGSELGD